MGLPQCVRSLPAAETQETWVSPLEQEDPMEEENENLLQYACLKNPMDRGAWWATVYRVESIEHN